MQTTTVSPKRVAYESQTALPKSEVKKLKLGTWIEVRWKYHDNTFVLLSDFPLGRLSAGTLDMAGLELPTKPGKPMKVADFQSDQVVRVLGPVAPPLNKEASTKQAPSPTQSRTSVAGVWKRGTILRFRPETYKEGFSSSRRFVVVDNKWAWQADHWVRGRLLVTHPFLVEIPPADMLEKEPIAITLRMTLSVWATFCTVEGDATKIDNALRGLPIELDAPNAYRNYIKRKKKGSKRS